MPNPRETCPTGAGGTTGPTGRDRAVRRRKRHGYNGTDRKHWPSGNRSDRCHRPGRQRVKHRCDGTDRRGRTDRPSGNCVVDRSNRRDRSDWRNRSRSHRTRGCCVHRHGPNRTDRRGGDGSRVDGHRTDRECWADRTNGRGVDGDGTDG